MEPPCLPAIYTLWICSLRNVSGTSFYGYDYLFEKTLGGNSTELYRSPKCCTAIFTTGEVGQIKPHRVTALTVQTCSVCLFLPNEPCLHGLKGNNFLMDNSVQCFSVYLIQSISSKLSCQVNSIEED